MFVKKGLYGYIKSGRIRSIVYTVGMFALSLGLFLMGWYSTGTKKNLLTVVAVCGCLPACKSAVNLIMFLKAKPCPEADYQKIHEKEAGLCCLYDLQMTSYEHTFQIDSLVLHGKTICGYTSNPKCKMDLAEKHILSMLQQNSLKEYTVKIFHDLPKYLNRMEQLSELDAAETSEEAIELMRAISL